MNTANHSKKISAFIERIVTIFCAVVFLFMLVACSESDVDSSQNNNYPLNLKQTNSEGRYGTVVATDSAGNTLAVSAIGRNWSEESGTVYVFSVYRTSSDQIISLPAELKPKNNGAAQFGHDVSISADGMKIAIGAPAEIDTVSGVNGAESDGQTCYGSVYIFSRVYDENWTPQNVPNWTQESFIRASIRYIFDDSSIRQDCSGFGLRAKLSSDGRTLGIVGERAIFIYEFLDDTWQEVARLAPETFDGRYVGIDIETNSLAIGIKEEALQESSSYYEKGGVVYIYDRTAEGWQQSAILTASNGEYFDHFGSSVAFGRGIPVNGISNTSFLVVGAPGEASAASGVNGDQTNNSMPGAGAIYVFENNGSEWEQSDYIKPNDPSVAANFGFSISTDKDAIVVGAPLATVNISMVDGIDSTLGNGAVYGFYLYAGEWIQSDYITTSEAKSGDQFGFSVSVSNHINSGNGLQLAVGAPFTNDEVGTVYLY